MKLIDSYNEFLAKVEAGGHGWRQTDKGWVTEKRSVTIKRLRQTIKDHIGPSE